MSDGSSKDSQGASDGRATARRGVVVFTVATCVASWAFLAAVRAGLPIAEWMILVALSWIPGLIALGMRAGSKIGFSDAGWRVGQLRWWVIAFCVPFLLAAATYGVAYLIGEVEITPHLRKQSMYGPVPFRLTWFWPEGSTASLLAQRVSMVLAFGIPFGFFCALGEEIGWRGFLLPKLVEGGFRFPILISGVIWGIWHVPFVLMFYQNHVAVTAALYFLCCVVFAVFIGWTRLASGSVFVAGMAHAAYNAAYQDVFEHSFTGPRQWFWAGEVGLLCSVVFGLLAVWLYRTGRIRAALECGGETANSRTDSKRGD